MTNPSNTKLFIRGGQTFLHSLTMFNQVANKLIFISFLLFTLVFALLLIKNSNAYDRYVGKKWALTYMVSGIHENPERKTEWALPNGQIIQVSDREILASSEIAHSLSRLQQALSVSLFESTVMYLIIFALIAYKLRLRGKKQGESKIIRGLPLVDQKTLIKTLKKQKPRSPYNIARVPLPFNSETQHVLFVGTTGSGKTVAIRELLQTIRKRGERAIIYDKGGTYIAKFYREGKDIILNPLDARGRAWDVWQECEDKADFEALAEALMPMPLSSAMDPFWVNAARMIFVSAANELKKNPNRSNLMLLQYLLTKDVGSIYELIKHTESESLVSSKVEKTALNVKAVMATYLKSLGYLKTEGEFFSIRDWIANEENDGVLFISSNGRKHPTLRPLISAWINTAAKELLSLTENENRRIWFIFDELATLHMLPFLEPAMSETRKFGGCFILGYHGVSQLKKIYGSDGASCLSNFCSTRVYLRLNDEVDAKWGSANIGTVEIEEVNEGISYGANTIRDGISISRQVKEKQLVLPSEITQLNDLEAYLKVKGKFSPANIQFNYVCYPNINPDFIERMGEKDVLTQEVEALIEQYEDPVLAEQHDKALEEKSSLEKEEETAMASQENDKDLTDYL